MVLLGLSFFWSEQMKEPTQSTPPASLEPGSEDAPKQSPEGTEDLSDLSNDAKQAEYRKAYLEQLRRMSCPGCGEDPTLPF